MHIAQKLSVRVLYLYDLQWTPKVMSSESHFGSNCRGNTTYIYMTINKRWTYK